MVGHHSTPGQRRHKGGQNLARFDNKRFDEIYQRIRVLPDGQERDQLFFEGKRLLSVYVPYKHHVHRILTDLTWPWVIGFRRPPYWRDWWPYIDIDAESRRRRSLDAPLLDDRCKRFACRTAYGQCRSATQSSSLCVSDRGNRIRSRTDHRSCTRAPLRTHIFDGLYRLRPSGAPVQDQAEYCRRDAGSLGRLSRVDS